MKPQEGQTHPSKTPRTKSGAPTVSGLDLEKDSRFRSRENFFFDIPFYRTHRPTEAIRKREISSSPIPAVTHPGLRGFAVACSSLSTNMPESEMPRRATSSRTVLRSGHKFVRHARTIVSLSEEQPRVRLSRLERFPSQFFLARVLLQACFHSSAAAARQTNRGRSGQIQSVHAKPACWHPRS
jgi:hypothetical protein